MKNVRFLFNKYKRHIIIDGLFILVLVFSIYYVINFKFGSYFLAGDFRFNVYKELQGDYVLSLVSNKYSMNNFIHIPFYSVYFLLQYIPYSLILIYIFFGIPVFIYSSTKFIIYKITHVSNFYYNILFSSLAFYVALYPAIFTRYIHWTTLHSIIFFPLFLYIQYCFLVNKRIFNKYFFILPVIIYLGAMTPQYVVVYILASILMWLCLFIFFKRNIKIYIIKSILLLISGILAFFHIIFPILIGYIQSKSDYEGITSGNVLEYFAKNSTFYSALSGTNFFEPLLKYPLAIGTGYIIFILLLIFLILTRKKNIINLILLFSALFIFIAVAGYSVFPLFFDLLNATFFSHYLWLAKDPNMYYLFFIVLVVLLLARIIVLYRLRPIFIIILSIIIFFSNLLFIYASDKKEYNEYYPFVNIPNEYFKLAEFLKDDEGRNYWLPSSTYVGKKFTGDMIIFPSPSWWLTKNKELVYYSTPVYQKLMKTIDDEIFQNDCKNIHFLDWIISAQRLNLIIDHNSVNTKEINSPDTESDIKKAELCIGKLQYVYKYKTIGPLDIYKSKLDLKNEVYKFQGTISGLNKFVEKTPANIIFRPSDKEVIKLLNIKNFTILDESYDENWLDEYNKPPVYKVNLASMLFEGDNRTFHYRGEADFQKAVFFQKLILAFFVVIFIIILYKRQNPVK